VAQTVTIGEQKVCPVSESLKFSTTPTPQVENPSDFDSPTPQPWLLTGYCQPAAVLDLAENGCVMFKIYILTRAAH